MKFLSAVVVVLAAQSALAYGPWLEKTPIGWAPGRTLGSEAAVLKTKESK